MTREIAIGTLFFKDNNGEVDEKKALIHARRWDVYNSEKEAFLKGRCLIEVSYNYMKRVILEVVDDHVVEEGVDHEGLGLRCFDFN